MPSVIASALIVRRPSIHARRLLGLAALVAAAVIALGAQVAAASSPKRLVNLIENVDSAAGVVYGAHATNGLSLDALTVIAAPTPGRYLGVFDTIGPGNLFVTRLATSDDLRTWQAGVVLSMHGSMPTITEVDGAYLLAFESATPNGDSQIAVERFGSLASLEAGRPDAADLLARHLSAVNEGTPSFDSVDLSGGLRHSRIVIGFHYNTGDGVDRNGIGVLSDFSVWTEARNVTLNKAMQANGVHGSIGERDAVALDGASVEVVEGQQQKYNWSSWGLYAYEPSTGAVTPLSISTPRGSGLSIGVGRAAIVKSASGHRLLVVSAYVYSQGSPAGTAGEIVWWRPVQ
jgi:hypothetical protein